MKDFSDTTIIIPTLNEESNISLLIARLKQLYTKIKIIVADDGSSDNTRKIARQCGVRVIDRTHKLVKGITISVLDASREATTKNIIVMDADFQHPPEKVAELRVQMQENDIVIAVRRCVLGHWGFFRKAQSRIATFIAILRLRKHIRDPLSGFFGIKTQLLQGLNTKHFELQCFKILFNLLKTVDLRRTKVGYIFYDFDMRAGGKSKIGLKHVLYFLRSVVK